MGPKKKGGGKKGKKGAKSKQVTVEGEISKEELEKLIVKLREELERERFERNWFQAECDRVKTFWDITKRQLEDKQAELRNTESAVEDAEERHQIEIKVFKQKVKHLLFEHKQNVDELHAENTVALKLAAEKHYASELELRQEKRALKEELKQQQLAHEKLVKSLKKLQAETQSELTAQYEERALEIESKYQEKLKELNAENDLRRKTELHELEERKNLQINKLMKNHEKAFTDIKNYYNDITLNNLALINTLKDQMEETRRKDETLEKHVAEVATENRRLKEPLAQASTEITELKAKTADHEKLQIIHASTKVQLKNTSKELQEVQLENEIMEQRYAKLAAERAEIYATFLDALHEVNQKASYKNLLLEKKLSAIRQELELKETQLGEILASTNLDPSSMAVVARRMEEVVTTKNRAIDDLQYELARVCKAHDELMHTYEVRLTQLGVSLDETGFIAIKTKIKSQKIGKGPAGLVSAPR